MNHNKIVTGIEEIDKKRSKICIDHEEIIVLYKGEITQYKIDQQEEISEADYLIIKKEILPKRAKKRCLNLLKNRSYTEAKLREKLKEGFYPEEIIDEAINYVKSYHYIDDYEYACQYIFYHKESESKNKMEDKLRQKGITKKILEQAFETSYDGEEERNVMEYAQARKLLEKKHYKEDMEWKEKQKVYAFLMRKGIRSSIIKKAMSIQDFE